MSDRATLEPSGFVADALVKPACSVPEGVVVGIENRLRRVLCSGDGHGLRAELLKALPLDLKCFPEVAARCAECRPPLLLVRVVEGVVPEDYNQRLP